MDFLFINLSLAFLLTGLVSGFIAGLLGVGGGIIIVPITYFILLNLGYSSDIIMHVAIASSLGTIVFTSISSMLSHIYLQNVELHIIKKWAPGIIVGSLLGAFIATLIDGKNLVFVFVFVLFLISVNMFFQNNILIYKKNFPKNNYLNFIISNLIGFFSALIGIGGGSFSVPTMSVFSIPIHKAIGTSAVIGFFIAIPSVFLFTILGNGVENLPPYSFGYANLMIISLVSITSIFTANLGAKFSSKTKKNTLKKIFAVFLLCTCISLIIENVFF